MEIINLLFFFNLLFAWKMNGMESGVDARTQSAEVSIPELYKDRNVSRVIKGQPITTETEQKPESKSEYESDADQKSYRVEVVELKVFQKIRVPEGGPYCYPVKMNQVKHESKWPQKMRHTPELREKAIPGYPIGITDTEWPYEVDQTEKKKEIRKFIQLNVSPDRYKDIFRYTGEDAERAFISRYYGFINPSENERVDDLIRLIDDSEKIANHLLLDTEPDPLDDFNSRSSDDKIKFCKKHINFNAVLLDQKIDFDPSDPNKIFREQITVLYKHDDLQNVKDIVEAVVCPCTDNSQNQLKLGVLPIRYKYSYWHDFTFAFIYNIWENSKKEPTVLKASVRALVKIDENGLAKRRHERNHEMKKLQKIREKKLKKLQLLDEKTKNAEIEKERNGLPGILTRFLSRPSS